MPTPEPTPTDPNAPSDVLVEQAAAWLVKISSGNCSAEQQQEFLKWQQQSPAHQKAVERMQGMISQLQQLQQEHHPQHQIIEQAIHEQDDLNHKLNISSLILIFALSTLLLGLLSWQVFPVNHWLADTSNRYDQWSTQTLMDHSQISISGHTAYNIKYDHDQRTIQLLEGNILVDVAKDASRPFVVKTEFASITALGTRFIVQHYDEQTILTMLESRVAVQPHSSSQQYVIEAGQQVVIDSTGIHHPQTISPAMLEQAWQKHSIVIDQMPLDQVLDILQSYQKGKIYYHRDELKALRVTAILPLDQNAFTLLQDSLPIEIKQPLPYITQVKLKK